jgi:cell division protein FtsZ
MTKEGLINLDFADVRAIMSEMGKAMMGTGEATGEKRAIEAAEAAISNPLLDDVSMRGARGLLISITGGPDLTLYEVDEAATRIREEVDSEANIILGATFDDSLEGSMRVSVVATGLASERVAVPEEHAAEEPAPVPARPVFGYTGKQPIPVKKPVQPLPAAQRPRPQQAQPQPVQVQQPKPEPQPQVAEEEYETEEVQEQPAVAARIAQPRMPQAEDFPPIAQRQIAAQQTRIENIADAAAKKKRGLFERLAGVGLARKADPVEPQLTQRSEPRIPPQEAQRAAALPQQVAQQMLDDDQLEIPAFLRRQAN